MWERLSALRQQDERQGSDALPTLVLGLGGSGTATARRVKRLVQQRYGDVEQVCFLFFDCDQRAYGPAPDLAAVEAREQTSIVATNAANVYQMVRNGDRPNIAAWLPGGADISILTTATGAGGMRPVGRFALFCQLDNVRNALRGAAEVLNGLRQTMNAAQAADGEWASKTRVVIVNSICGGTGSSIFLDLALLARDALGGRDHCEVAGVFYMPSVFEREPLSPLLKRALRTNAYAALKEIEYWSDPAAHQPGKPPWQVNYGPQSAQTDGPLFDWCYVVERQNAHGKLLAGKDDVFEMVARSVALDLDGVLGRAVRSAEVNVLTALKTGGHFHGRPALFHGLATSSARVPVEEMTVYGGLTLAQEVVADHLIGHGEAVAECRQRVERVLHEASLDETGEGHRLATTQGASLSYDVGLTRADLEAAAAGAGYRGEAGRARYAASELERLRQRLEVQVAGTVANQLQQGQGPAWQAAAKSLTTALGEVLVSSGLRGAEAFLERLRDALQAGADKLRQATKAYEDQSRVGTTEALDSKIAFLKEYGGLSQLLFQPQADEQAMDDGLELLQAYGEGEYRLARQRAAFELLTAEALDLGDDQARPGLVPLVKHWLGQVQRAQQAAQAAQQCLADEVQKQRPQDAGLDAFVLDQSVLPAKELDAWIDRAQVRPETIAADLRQELAGRSFDPLRWLDALSGGQAAAQAAGARLADTVAAGCGAPLKAWLLDHAQLLRVVSNQDTPLPQQDLETLVAGPLQAKVRALARACQPFWTAGGALNPMQQYEAYAAIGVPCPSGTLTSAASRVKQQITEAADFMQGVQVELEYVPVEQPYRLDVVTRFFGTTAYNMGSVRACRDDYLHPDTSRELYHVDRRFVDLLPDLYPEDAAVASARQLFAWGVAYGYIARRGNNFYLGVEGTESPGATVHPRYETDWVAAVKPPEADYAPLRQMGTSPDKSDLLDTGRAAAMEALVAAPEDRLEALAQARQAYMGRWGGDRVQTEVTAYLTRLEEARAKAQPEMQQQLDVERDALRTWLKSF